MVVVAATHLFVSYFVVVAVVVVIVVIVVVVAAVVLGCFYGVGVGAVAGDDGGALDGVVAVDDVVGDGGFVGCLFFINENSNNNINDTMNKQQQQQKQQQQRQQ